MNASVRSLPMILVFTVLLICSGCASVNPEPFQKFATSTSDLKDAADGAISQLEMAARRAFMAPSSLGDQWNFDDFVLTIFDNDSVPPAQNTDRPFYLQIRDIRTGVYDLNAAMADYAQYLALLAGGGEYDVSQMEALAVSANENLGSALGALQQDAHGDSIALISVIGAEGYRHKIVSDRRNYLLQSLEFGQPTVEKFPVFMATTMYLLAGDTKRVYASDVDQLRRQYSSAKNDTQRLAIVQELLALNDRTLTAMQVFEALQDSYGQLPVAHSELLEGLRQAETSIESIKRLYSDAQRLRQLQKQLAEASTVE